MVAVGCQHQEQHRCLQVLLPLPSLPVFDGRRVVDGVKILQQRRDKGRRSSTGVRRLRSRRPQAEDQTYIRNRTRPRVLPQERFLLRGARTGRVSFGQDIFWRHPAISLTISVGEPYHACRNLSTRERSPYHTIPCHAKPYHTITHLTM